MMRKVNIAMIIVNGRLLLECKLLKDEECLLLWSKYRSKFRIASGIISRRAIDRNRDPENVMAMLMIDPSLKHFMPEINLPKSMT